MVSHIIIFLLGAYSGVAFMCLFQINKKTTGKFSDISGEATAEKREGGVIYGRCTKNISRTCK